MKFNQTILCVVFFMVVFAACKSDAAKKDAEPKEEKTEITGTPVTIVSPEKGSMTDAVELNAVSSFLLKTFVKANANGYLQIANAQLGRFVSKGEELFVIKTKESQSLGNTINSVDSSLHFDGVIHIKSPGTGYITQINYRAGDYIQDGEQLATITDTKSFVFLLDLPYELKPFLPNNNALQLKLPDGTIINGRVDAALPTVDAVSQTQSYIIKVNTEKQIPENLIAKVSLIKRSKINTTSLPKAAVLSNEIQTEFWIMKMIDSTTVVKLSVQKGLETTDHVEIVSPMLSPSDKIVLTGNYGLGDTAKVIIIK
jgi:multidrug efflux pump subunit AcrA (membrane-fusion protein)